MEFKEPLSGGHLHSYNKIFQHPLSHNLEWHEVQSLMEAVGHVEQEANGNLKVTRNGQIVLLHPHRQKDAAEADEIMTLRHFLERSGKPAVASGGQDIHQLLVIDHHQARLFRSQAHGTQAQHLLPHEPADFFRHAHNSKDFARGQEKPDPNSFFEPVAAALKGGGTILVFGTGTGMASEMEQFIAWLRVRHPEVASRIIGSETVDENHLTSAQLLAKARQFYVNARISCA